jgi:hypothetical protein
MFQNLAFLLKFAFLSKKLQFKELSAILQRFLNKSKPEISEIITVF